MTTPVRYSHSSLSTFRECEQKFEYAYIHRLESNTDKWAVSRDLGSSIHAGIAKLLEQLYDNPDIPLQEQIDIVSRESILEADTYVYKEPEWGTDDLDEYHHTMAIARDTIPELANTIIPQLELGSRYTVAGAYEFGLTTDLNTPLVEYEFVTYDVTPDGRERRIEGIIDAVLVDNTTGDYILYDWKVRGKLLPLQHVVMDMQLPLYATILNGFAFDKGLSATIDVVRMYQMLSSPPKPAKLTQKNVPSIQASASYWEFWWESIPYPIRNKLDPSTWYDKMVTGGKLRDKSDWIAYEDIPVTGSTSIEVSLMVENTINRIERAIADKYFLPVWGSYNCQTCQYAKLCMARRDGDWVDDVVAEHYHKK